MKTPEEKKLFGERIRDLREKRNLKQDELALLIGKSRDNIASYETGRSTPPADALINMADVFKISTDFLLGRTEDPTPPKIDDELPSELEIKKRKFRMEMDDILRRSSNMDDKMIEHTLMVMEMTFVEGLNRDKNKK
ncbi:helix-turn-helix domain-containing protein [Paenibacillus sp. 2RAB27]|uniref:helix-turn-helix domain-containing protein n=1 Tax=Paenibacillus sp. 2RAB27 TaxID=3232991 RepID=UPI003F96540D